MAAIAGWQKLTTFVSGYKQMSSRRQEIYSVEEGDGQSYDYQI